MPRKVIVVGEDGRLNAVSVDPVVRHRPVSDAPTLREAPPPPASVPAPQDRHVCACGFVAASAAGLAAHQRAKHVEG